MPARYLAMMQVMNMKIKQMAAILMALAPFGLSHAAEPKADITLDNESLHLGFDSLNAACVSLKDVRSGHQFLESLPVSPILWCITLEKPDGSTFLIRSTMVGSKQVRKSAKNNEVTLQWGDLEIAGEKKALSVKVTVTLPPGVDRSYWRIEVDNRSKCSMSNVQFPYLSGISKPKQPAAAVPRETWGNLEQAVEFTRGSYPSSIWPMQFLAVLEKDSGLYLAYEDPTSTVKYFDFTPGKNFFFTSFPENITVPGNDFQSPGPVAIGICGSDWWKAAKMYRQWALQQKWTSRGPLTQESNIPDKAKNIGIWFNDHVVTEDPEWQSSQIKAAQDFFQLPMAVQLYSWHHARFDTEYPEYFPAKPEFQPLVQTLVSSGAFVAPYVNGRLQDLNVKSAEQARPFLVKKRDGTNPVEDYESGAKLGVMCPATKYWQDVMQNVARELVKSGVNAIYFDQIAAAEPYLCFDASHGHPLGGGSYWVDGYRRMLSGVKELRTADGSPVLVASENTTECYMDVIDAFLTWTPRRPDDIPLLTAVYSGYAIYFGTNARVAKDSGLGPFAMIVGRDVVWGTQPGWMAIDVTSDRGAYLRDAARFRYAGRQYFQFGELVGELKPTNDPGTTTGGWKDVGGEKSPTDVTLPAVVGTIWKSPSGRLGLAMANLTGEEKTFACDVAPADYGLAYSKEKGWSIRSIESDGAQPEDEKASELKIKREEKLKPWELKLIEVTSG